MTLKKLKQQQTYYKLSNRLFESFHMQTSRKRCFVIMPFSLTTETHTREYWDNHFENFLKPLIDSCSEVQAFRSVPMRQDIINDLVFSPIVVADLTDSNPNVYWELGVRQSFRHGTITIANEDTKNLPFDIRTKAVLFYPSDMKARDTFSRKFKDAIIDCISNPNKTDSIVLETITGRGSIYSVIHHQEIIQKLDGLIAENRMNIDIFKIIIRAIVDNKDKKFALIRGGLKMIVTQFACSAMDYLLAERFLEEGEEFYKSVHSLRTWFHSMNQRLSAWDYNSNKDTTDYFLEYRDQFKLYSEDYEKKLVNAKTKLLLAC
jgi:hypothetical protein